MKTGRAILVVILAAMLVACTAKLPLPKQPSKSNRTPINKNVPIELEGKLYDTRVQADQNS